MGELEIKKLKIKNIILLIVIVLLILALGAFSYYTFFIKDDVKDNFPIDVSKLTENFNYGSLLNQKSKKISDLTPKQMMIIAYKSYGREISNYEYEYYPDMNYSRNFVLITKDRRGVIYPDYSKETKELYCDDATESYLNVGQVKNMARYMNFDVSEIEKMDTSLFSCYGGGGGGGDIYVLDSDFMSSQMKKIFGTDKNIFDKSFNYMVDESINNLCGFYTFVYDKNIDKLFINITGGCTVDSISSTSVIREYVEDDLYKMDIVEYMIGVELYDNNYPKTVKIYNVVDYRKDYLENEGPKEVGNITINSKEDEENIGTKTLKYKDKLDKYTLNFKKFGDDYQFVSIEHKG